MPRRSRVGTALRLSTLAFALLACEPAYQHPPNAAPPTPAAPGSSSAEASPPAPAPGSVPAGAAPSAAGPATSAAAPPILAPEPAPDVPAPRDRDYPWMSIDAWQQRQRQLLAIDPALKRDSKLAFLGDSITEMWDDAVWKESFGRYRPLRLGIGGDKTQQLLYRIDQGELDGVGARVVVVLIGTNNFGLGEATPSSVALGVAAVLSRVTAKLPKARLLLLGILPREMAAGYGCTGPVLRGSGVDHDLRRDGEPIYTRMYQGHDFDIPVAPFEDAPPEVVVGDNWCRFYVRMIEVVQAIRLVRQALDKYPTAKGEFRVPFKMATKLPRAECYLETEAPRGQMGFYVVGMDAAEPWRARAKSSSFCNLSVTSDLCRGCLIADIPAIVGSLDIVMGEIDR